MSFIDDITNFVLGVSGILDQVDNAIIDGEALVENVRAEARKIKDFQLDPKWNTRVINAPAAVTQTHDLVTNLSSQIADAFHAFISNLKGIKRSRLGTSPEGHGGTAHVLAILTTVKNVINEIDQLFKSLNSFVDALRQIQDELQSFDTLFLQQGNLRKNLHITDGTDIKIRLGGLHKNS